VSAWIIFTVAVCLYAAGVTAIGVLKGKKYSWIMSCARVGATVIAAITAIFVSKLLARVASDMAFDKLMSLLGDTVKNIAADIPAGDEGLRVLVSLLVAPILFLPVFGLIRLILMIAIWVVEKCVSALGNFRSPAVSMPLGALNGLLIAFVTLIPVCGFMALGGGMLHSLADADMCNSEAVQKLLPENTELTEADMRELGDSLEKNPVVIVVHNTVGKPVFRGLTTARLDAADTHGETVQMHLETEVTTLVLAAGDLLEAIDAWKSEDFSAEDKEVLCGAADGLFESEWTSMLAADAAASLAEKWLNGEPFAGVSRPALDARLDPVFTSALTILTQENGDTLQEDVRLILDILGDFKLNGLLDGNVSGEALLQKLGADGMLTDLMSKLQSNDRMAPLVTEVKTLGVRLLTDMLGVEELKSGEYADTMNEMAGTLTDALDMSKEERDALVVESVQSSLAEKGYDVPPEVIVEVTDTMIEDLGGDGEITSDELTDYLVEHADEFAGEIPDGVMDGLLAG